MITNILATIVVCVVTNITHWDNEVRAPHQFSWAPNMEPQPGSVIQPATEKTETTEVVEIKTLHFEWEGKTYTGEHKRVLSRSVRRWRKHETWELDENGKETK